MRGRRQQASRGRPGRGNLTLRFAKLDRAKLQTGTELFRLGPLPGEKRSLDPASLAIGLLRLFFLLVGACT